MKRYFLFASKKTIPPLTSDTQKYQIKEKYFLQKIISRQQIRSQEHFQFSLRAPPPFSTVNEMKQAYFAKVY